MSGSISLTIRDTKDHRFYREVITDFSRPFFIDSPMADYYGKGNKIEIFLNGETDGSCEAIVYDSNGNELVKEKLYLYLKN